MKGHKEEQCCCSVWVERTSTFPAATAWKKSTMACSVKPFFSTDGCEREKREGKKRRGGGGGGEKEKGSGGNNTENDEGAEGEEGKI